MENTANTLKESLSQINMALETIGEPENLRLITEMFSGEEMDKDLMLILRACHRCIRRVDQEYFSETYKLPTE